MTTRTKRTAKPRQIEALIGSDRGLLKELMKEALQEVLEAEMTEALGAGPGERTADRVGYRSGYYSRGLAVRHVETAHQDVDAAVVDQLARRSRSCAEAPT